MTALYAQLDGMKPFTSISMAKITSKEARERYIDAVKQYIDDNHPEVEFDTKYTKVKKNLKWTD